MQLDLACTVFPFLFFGAGGGLTQTGVSSCRQAVLGLCCVMRQSKRSQCSLAGKVCCFPSVGVMEVTSRNVGVKRARECRESTHL
eukprot:1157480-Pelagomonas_calceolata.AAC.2